MAEERDWVAEARTILERAGFPLDRIQILPAGAAASLLDRRLVLEEAMAVMADGQPRKARQIAALINQRGRIRVERRDVNSVLSREGRGLFVYDPTTFTYRYVGPADQRS